MKRVAVAVTWMYFIAMAVLVTFPGLEIANRVEPYVLGLPFVLAWFMMWITGAFLVLILLYHTHRS